MNEEEIIMNEEEIIEFIDQLYGVEREYYNLVRVKNTENIITAIKSAIILYQNEKEKNKKLEEELNKFMNGEVFSANQAKYMEKKNKIFQEVIDMIASDYIQDYLYNERSDYPCEYYYDEIKKKEDCKQGKIGACEECLKAYYFKVAKGEEYKNKYCGGED